MAIISEERREAEEERKRIQANIEEHKKLEAVQQVEMKRVRHGSYSTVYYYTYLCRSEYSTRVTYFNKWNIRNT